MNSEKERSCGTPQGLSGNPLVFYFIVNPEVYCLRNIVNKVYVEDLKLSGIIITTIRGKR